MTEIITKLRKPKPTKVFDTFWRFATERQKVFFKRVNRDPFPWTENDIFNEYKFTNVYRASDRVSQYLIKSVIYQGPQEPNEIFFRIILFKLFNRIETWELIINRTSEISTESFSKVELGRILSEAMANGEKIYSGAYIMASGRSAYGFAKKHENHLALMESMVKEKLYQKIEDSKSLEKVFQLLRERPTLGNFLAFQFTIDLNYSELINFSEMDFVVPGPGAKSGIAKCFRDYGDFTETDIIKYLAEIQENEFQKRNLDFDTLWGRELQLIDIQNLFCEVDKYSRVAHPEMSGVSVRKRIKQRFTPNEADISFWYPPKWGINSYIQSLKKIAV